MAETQTLAMERYQAWLADPNIDEATKEELRSIADDAQEIEDRFFRELAFGTGGLRGVIGAGTNRMNRYIVGKATQGLAQYVRRIAGEGQPAVAIAYDSRHQSPEFALEAARVLAGNGVRAYVFPELRPTPELSFAVRHLQATAGIVITASHNPPEYNGYKVYGADGGQLVPADAEQVIAEIRDIATFDEIKRMEQQEAERQGLLVWLDASVDEAFISALARVSFSSKFAIPEDFQVVYTPLHGTGNRPVRAALQAIGVKHVHVVAEQEMPDPNFSTVKSPNPEERDAFRLAIQKAEAIGADVVIGTDPDADRMGAVVKDRSGQYAVLSGNQSGAIMAHYLLSRMKEEGTLPANGAVIKTIVTSEMGACIAESFGMKTLNTLTGFKYIGEKMTEFERTGEHTFLFGYEESYGYLAGDYARDKDAVVASMLICEAAAWYKSHGKSLADVLEELYEQFGYFLEALESRTMKGKTGMERIAAIMEDWRAQPPAEVAGVKVRQLLDYSQGIDGLPKENVLKFMLEDGSWFCLRPSGTEPKIKVYFAVCRDSGEASHKALQALVTDVMARVDRM
ncbi:phospho-sugar mutase [Xylanibacillus composti]|uniref:Phosphoglucomutase n=1 Tax=Xylanibacillus composti TaxID=1572762 RepID=A0A8J4M481_9BACL|nr:phospho-sugar mutase [Xylanibacillus composti]MDT9725964.1 phospho-sugar mutase [Xylanibacillus composti]GIQ70882.1 phosphoglucomutase [Xylanibacillus composti]